jgi:hypothetical protein
MNRRELDGSRPARRFTALALVAASASCASGPAPVESGGGQPALAVFPVEKAGVKLERLAAEEIDAHLEALVGRSEGYRPVPGDVVRSEIARRKRKGGDPRCATLKCRSRLGPAKLGADLGLGLRLSRGEAPRSCALELSLLDLRQEEVLVSARAAAPGCAPEELAEALHKAFCEVVGRDRTRRGAATGSSGGAARSAAPGGPGECLARADFALAEQRLSAFDCPTLRDGQTASEHETRMAERVLSIRGDYARVVGRRVPRWTAAALCRTGKVYEVHADNLARGCYAKPPPVRGGRHPASRRGATDGPAAGSGGAKDGADAARATPFREQAIHLYQECLRRAAELGVTTPEVEEARRRLEAIGALPRKPS